MVSKNVQLKMRRIAMDFKSNQIAEGIFWVGSSEIQSDLRCNPYLLLDSDEAVLFEPGSVLDFEYVLDNIKKIVPLEKIKYIVLGHQDPDLCSSIPLFEKLELILHWLRIGEQRP